MRPAPTLRQLLAAALAAVALGAAAQPQPPQPQDPADPAEAAFRTADTNKDHQLSREEAAKLPIIATRFDELDRNRDGFLSFEEFRAGYRSQP